MSTWTDLVDEVKTITNRSDLDGETNIAVRNAIRTAHKSGKYWRDLVQVNVPLAVDSSNPLQSIDLSAVAPRFRQMATLKYRDYDIFLKDVTIDDLLDTDDYPRVNIYYGLGATVKIRAETQQDNYTMTYYQYPVVFPQDNLSSWIVDEHRDLIVLWAASTVLATVGEQEIKGRIDQLAAVCYADLQQDNLEIRGR